MTQVTIGTIDPVTTSGTELATLLSNFETARLSNNSGSARPSYAVVGTTWIKTISSTNHTLYYWDGVHEVPLLEINPTTGTSKVTTADVALTANALSGGITPVPNTRTISSTGSLTGGGDLTANRTLSLVNDSTTPGNSRYYGTDSSGTKGYFALPTPPVPQLYTQQWFDPGVTSWTAPANVTSIFLTVIGGGRNTGTTKRAGSFSGVYYTTPGTTYSIRVGYGADYYGAADISYQSSFNNELNRAFGAASASSGVVVQSGHGLFSYAPAIRTVKGNILDEPFPDGSSPAGYVRIQWIA